MINIRLVVGSLLYFACEECFFMASRSQSIISIYDSPNVVLNKWWKKKLFIRNINMTGLKKVHVAYGSWSSWRHESLFSFAIKGPRFFPRVAVTIISKDFVQKDIISYYRVCTRAVDCRIASSFFKKAWTLFSPYLSVTILTFNE